MFMKEPVKLRTSDAALRPEGPSSQSWERGFSHFNTDEIALQDYGTEPCSGGTRLPTRPTGKHGFHEKRTAKTVTGFPWMIPLSRLP